jgi:hypothetical protein
MDTGTIAMLDTAEYETVSVKDLLPRRPMSAVPGDTPKAVEAPTDVVVPVDAVAPEPPAAQALVAPPVVADVATDVATEVKADVAVGPAEDDAPAADGSPRRKRRRGRRGGRRLRAAEERRKTDGGVGDHRSERSTQARIGGLSRSAHSSQARFNSDLSAISAI